MKGLPWQSVVVPTPAGHAEGHCVPVMDIQPHLLRGGECRCCPKPDPEVPDVWSHRAFDQRESYENGRALH